VRDDSRKIFTSTLTITEVAFLGSERGGLSSDSEQIIDQLWNDDRIIAFIEPHEIIMRDARALIRKCIELSIKTLKPPDAIHIASAMALKVDEINTYDIKTWAKYEEMTGYEIREPHILDPRLFP
jgi:predicted nucleic acid-binding protein